MPLITEQDSHYDHLDREPLEMLLLHINEEDATVPVSVHGALPQIERLVTALVPLLRTGGRLFYIGSGTSGRLGILDASECPPTYGVPFDMVIGIIAGGDRAIRRAVEGAEDDQEQGIRDLDAFQVGAGDMVVGISASGQTPYTTAALRACRERGIATGCLTCNPDSEMSLHADFPVEVTVGPEFVTGSTRMKAGTAQKLVLNMITTSAMIRLGKVQGNKMTHMMLSNAKLRDRGVRILIERKGLSREEAEALLRQTGYDLVQALGEDAG